MSQKRENTSDELLNAGKSTNKDVELIVNKKLRTLDDLRQDFKRDKISVLSEVRDFLPKLATANSVLEKKLQEDPSLSVDIEHLDNEEAPHIEMNLALVEMDSHSEDSDSDSTDSSDSNDADESFGESVVVNQHNIKLPGETRKKNSGVNLIECIDIDSKTDTKQEVEQFSNQSLR